VSEVSELDPGLLVQVASEAARAGGRELQSRRHLKRQISFKHEIDLVTDADKASEAKILALIRERFPDHGILAEEQGQASGSAPYRWIVDPLDGTTNYAHAVPHYCVSIAVEGRGGRLLAGVVFDPIREELFTAALGQGAFLNRERLHVSSTAALGESLLAVGFPYDLWSHPEQPLALFKRFAQRARGMRRMGAAALDLAYVAAGRFEGFFEYRLKAWDVAAGALLVTEAGGTITHLLGGPLDLNDCDVLASNGALHPQMLEVIREKG
jgi:myo-inositol-1(or 4)-monophosphatase